MQAIRIEKGVPLPKTRLKYPVLDMAVGDSFFVPDATLRPSFYTLAKRHGFRVTVRNEGDGVRVWRVA